MKKFLLALLLIAGTSLLQGSSNNLYTKPIEKTWHILNTITKTIVNNSDVNNVKNEIYTYFEKNYFTNNSRNNYFLTIHDKNYSLTKKTLQSIINNNLGPILQSYVNNNITITISTDREISVKITITKNQINKNNILKPQKPSILDFLSNNKIFVGSLMLIGWILYLNNKFAK